MKAKIIFSCLMFGTMLTAQVTNLPTVLNINGDYDDKSTSMMFGIVPTSLSYDGTNRVYIRTADDQVAIYSNAFAPVKQFNILANYQGSQYRRATREVTVTVTGGELINEKLVMETWHDKNLVELYLNCTNNDGEESCEHTYNVPESWTENDVKNYLENIKTIISVQSYPEGGKMFIWDMEAFYADGSETLNYWEASKYGKKYPRVFYLWQNGYLYYCSNVYYSDQSEYSPKQVSFSYGDWTETGEYETNNSLQNWGLGFINFDNDQLNVTSEDGNGMCLTQTLFNEDAQYEYLHFPISSYIEANYGNSPNEPICTNCYSESTSFLESTSLFYRAVYSGFEIKSETGSTLQSITFPNGFIMKSYIHAQIIKLSNEFYIVCTGEMSDVPAMLVYKINRNSKGESIQQVSAPMRIGAYPNPVKHNQIITIQLSGENAGQAQTDLQVTNLQGQVLDNRSIPAGQQQTTISTANFAPGMNVINVLQNGKTIGTEKVIVQ